MTDREATLRCAAWAGTSVKRMSSSSAANDPSPTRLRFTGNPDDPCTVMIEPWGMTYDLDGSDSIYVDLFLPEGELPEIVAWPGGVSVYVGGRAVTRDSKGELLHEF